MGIKLFEHILGYSDHDGIGENELVEPLEDNMEELFEKIYFECNLRPLFEQICREAQHTSKLDEYYGVFMVVNKQISDKILQNTRVYNSLEEATKALRNLPRRKYQYVISTSDKNGNFTGIWNLNTIEGSTETAKIAVDGYTQTNPTKQDDDAAINRFHDSKNDKSLQMT